MYPYSLPQILFLSGLLVSVACQSVGQNLNFEETICVRQFCYYQDNPRGEPDGVVPGWNASGNFYVRRTNEYTCVPSGNWTLVFSPFPDTSPYIQQNLVTRVGMTYEISMRAAALSHNATLRVTIDSNDTDFHWNTAMDGCGEWDTLIVRFTAHSTNTTLRFTGAMRPDGGDTGLDNIVVRALDCGPHSDCNGNGICTNAGNSTDSPGYCSCFSGYTRAHCESPPPQSCYQEPVDSYFSAPQFIPNVYYDNLNVKVTFQINLEEGPWLAPGVPNTPPYSLHTIAYFGHNRTAFPNCGYPNHKRWIKSVDNSYLAHCSDLYTMTSNWTDIQESCGFFEIPGTGIYAQILTIERLQLLNTRGLQRVQKIQRELRIETPQSLYVALDPPLFSFPEIDFALTHREFNQERKLWTVSWATILPAPYFIINHTVTNLTANDDEEFVYRFRGSDLTTLQGCAPPASECYQQITYQFSHGIFEEACVGLNGEVMTDIELGCDLCPGSGKTNTTLQIFTFDACPKTFSYATTSHLIASSNPDLTFYQWRFSWFETAYFGLSVTFTKGGSYSLSLEELCFRLPNDTCVYPYYTLLQPDPNYNIKFSVAFTDPENADMFLPLQSIEYEIVVRLSTGSSNNLKRRTIGNDEYAFRMNIPKTFISLGAAPIH